MSFHDLEKRSVTWKKTRDPEISRTVFGGAGIKF